MSQQRIPSFVPDVAREARRAKPWVRGLCRAGYAARGVLYVTIGALAAAAAFGSGGATTDSKGALRTLHEAPFGALLLGVIAVGLAGFALWRFVQSVIDPERESAGRGKKGAGKRAGRALSGVLHVALAVYAVGLATRGALGSARAGGGARSWSARLMAWPAGPTLVVVAGLAVVAFGVVQVVRAWRAKLDERLDLSRLSAERRHAAVVVSRFGMASRGVVAAIVGSGLVLAGLHGNPGEAKGVGDALSTVQSSSYGGPLLAVVALGLVAFGVYQGLEARYRRIRVGV